MICIMKSSLKIFEMFETLLFFFKQKFILGDVFFKIPKNLIRDFFLPRQILKNRYASAKTSNAALVNLLIESLKMIM